MSIEVLEVRNPVSGQKLASHASMESVKGVNIAIRECQGSMLTSTYHLEHDRYTLNTFVQLG